MTGHRGRIALLLPNLKFGGGERVTLHLAAALRGRGYGIDILLMQSIGELLDQARRDFTVVDLRCGRTWQLPWRLALYLWRYRPVALISSFWKLNVCACLARLAAPWIRLVLWEHSPPSRSSNSPSWLYALTATVAYRMATRIVAVSAYVARDMASITWGLGGRVESILNPIPSPSWGAGSGIRGETARILWVARFAEPKNPALMLEAFARLDHEAATLEFIGDGPLRQGVEERARLLGLEQRVHFRGYQPEPYRFMDGADLLVVTSDSEGLSNVLIEALHAGLATVSTDCGEGVREVLMDGLYGEIVPPRDPEALAAAMRRLLESPPDRGEQRAGARRFDPDGIAERFLKALGLDEEPCAMPVHPTGQEA